ncbi:hypothetical protein RJ639_010109 [Escallonia herrerae]|uniref:AP2/ERF domain-containing protein n=1 Tax=Escallonia herrerae TaxID=1293975 RepID=A0AA89ASU8_9ASTE|nr:hypothetical protein RJ639_010109 [Escallonia herrerae]
MGDWLGFSLTPHLKIDGDVEVGGFGREDHHQSHGGGGGGGGGCFSPPPHHHVHDDPMVMPLRSDGSLFVMDPFKRSSTAGTCQDWRYHEAATMNGNDDETKSEDPKLEDFLGCYSSSPPPPEHHHHQEPQDHDDDPYMVRNTINVNVPPPPVHLIDEKYKYPEAAYASPFVQQYHYNNSMYNPSPLQSYQSYGHAPSVNNGNTGSGMYHMPRFEGTTVTTTSVSGFKSWLRQAPTPPCNGAVVLQEKKPSAADNQSLSLAVSPSVSIDSQQDNGRKRPSAGKSTIKEGEPRKTSDTFGQRTSQFRGVTRHRWTGRYEAHLWDNSCRKEGQTRKGRQGGYDKEEKAARAYDLAALKYWGPTTHINFPINNYESEVEEMKKMTRQEFVANLRRKSSGFSRGASVYRGVTRHHQHGRWQARIGRVAGNKDLYLGTQEEAAEAYDIAAIKFRGTSAVTNFDISRYDVKRICSSSTLIGGDLAKRSPKGSCPTSLENYNSCASSASPQPLLTITNGEVSEELTDMLWSADEQQQPQIKNSNADVSLVGSTSRNSSSPPSLNAEFGLGADYSQHAYFTMQGPKYEDGNNGSANRLGSLALVNQVPMFALWNE